MESNFPEVLDARGDQGAMEIKSPQNQGLLHSDVDYKGKTSWWPRQGNMGRNPPNVMKCYWPGT